MNPAAKLKTKRQAVRVNDPTEWAPAERVIEGYAAHLSTDQLVSVVMNVPVEFASTILDKFQRSLAVMYADLPRAIAAREFIGVKKAPQLLAALELGRRCALEARNPGQPLRSPKDVVDCVNPTMQDLPHEEFHVLILDAQHRLKLDVLITKGLLNSSLVHPREVFRDAIVARASAVILVHNHPSGDPTPSAEDRTVTTQLVAAGRMIDIPVHDHVVIGRGRYVSFAETGLL